MSNAGSVTVVLSANTTSFSAAMTEAQRNLDKFANKSTSAGHATVSGMQAASASIRLLENPLGNNTRAIERLISQSKILSSVMKAAFPLVGAIAIGSILTKLGKEVAEFIEKIRDMPASIKRGFNSLTLASETANDQLILTNDQLQNSINKLQGKPANNLKIGFDEAILAADKLAESIETDNDKLDQLLSKNHVTGWALLLNRQGTAEREGTVSYYGRQQDEAGLQYQQSIRNHDGAGAARALQALHDSQKFELDNVLSDRDKRKAQKEGPNNDANVGIDTGVATNILTQQNHEQQLLSNAQLTAENKKLEAQKAAAEAAKQAAAKVLEARKKAAEEQLHEWENENSDWKAEEDRSLSQDASWWKAKLNTLSTGSLNYRAVNKKVNDDVIADNRAYAAMIKTYTAEYLADGDKRNWVSSYDADQINKQGKATSEWIVALRTGIDLQRENADGLAQSSIQMASATGNMTKLDAAQALANIHTQQYTSQMDALKDAREGIENNGSLTDMERKAQMAQSDNAIASANGNRALQVAQDNQATNPIGSSASVGFRNALDEFVQSSKDAAAQMQELTRGTLTSLNTEILNGMSGQRTNFKGVGAGLASSVAGIGLQKAEGSVLSALGFGGTKADGTKSSPFYVRMADSVGSMASSIGSQVSSKSGGFLSSVLAMLPGFANGGAVSPGTLAMVGEKGPELAYFGSGGNVTPNHQLSTVGSSPNGAVSYNVNVANGVTPEQMKMHVRAALQEYHPHVVAASVAAVQAQKNRQTIHAR